MPPLLQTPVLPQSERSTSEFRESFCLPGETVQISDGKILIDGKEYQEAGQFPEITNPGLASTTVTLESGQYFVLGDNRNNSEDSRYSDIGNVNKRYIVGKLWFTCSPFEKFGFCERW